MNSAVTRGNVKYFGNVIKNNQLDQVPIKGEKVLPTRYKQIIPVEDDNPAIMAIGVHPPGQINILTNTPEVGPDPQECPCYLVDSNNTASNVRPSTTTPAPLIGRLAFIPVIFIPYCPGNEEGSETVKSIFPSAMSVPYPCDMCSSNNAGLQMKFLDLTQLGNIEHLQRALSQANFGLLNVPAKRPRGRRLRRRKTL